MYPFLSWLAPYMQSRNTIRNYHMSEEEEEKEQEEDEESKHARIATMMNYKNGHKHLNQRPQLLQLQEDLNTQEDGRRRG